MNQTIKFSNATVRKIQIILMAAFFTFFTTIAVFALQSFFAAETKHKVEFETNLPMFEVKETNSATKGKKVVPITMPACFDTNKYVHTLLFDCDAILKPNNITFSIPLYLKINTHFTSDTANLRVDDYFTCITKADNRFYDDSNRVFYNKPINAETKKVVFSVQMKQILTSQHNIYLNANYELVDRDGKGFESGTLMTAQIALKA